MRKILLSLSALILYSLTLTATTVLVTNTNDTGAGSLREAMQVTVQNGDTIRFDPNLIANGSDTITTLSGAIFTKKDITIIGLKNNIDTLYLSGGGTNQIFYITHSASGGAGIQKSLTLENVVMIDGAASRGGHLLFQGLLLTIKNSVFRNGRIPATTGTANEGGSIFFQPGSNSSSFLIEDCKFYNNVAQNGGAILTKYAGSVTINNSTFYNNQGTVNGGAITTLEQTDVNITNSNFFNNTTTGNGGALYCTNFSFSGSVVNLDVTSSSFHNNMASNGGGIAVIDVKPTIRLTTSTIHKNSASANCGGLYVKAIFNNTINVTIEKSTITKNIGLGTSGLGSGIWVYNIAFGSSEFLTLKGSIIADNGNNAIERNIRFSGSSNGGGSGFTSNGHNLLGEPSIFNSTVSSTDLMSATAATINLDSLRYNGGSTPTMLPLTGSLALNTGDTLDLTDAQNGTIKDGFRDRGAAEFVCFDRQTISPSACVSYTSLSGNYTWTTSGIYSDTLFGSACDTVYTINLSINKSTSTVNDTACNGNYTSPSGKIFTTPGIVLDTIPNALGCDSIMTIDVAFTSINNGIIFRFGELGSRQFGATYQWLDCNTNFTPITGEISRTYTPGASGNYAVEITLNGCIDTSICTAVVIVGINEVDLANAFTIYPNPTNKWISVQSDIKVGSISIISIEGKRMMQENASNKISIQQLPVGCYFVEIETIRGIVRKKIIKQ